MANTWTSNVAFATPAYNDANWDVPLRANNVLIDGMTAIGGGGVRCVEGDITTSASLNVKVGACTFVNSLGQTVAYAGVASQAMTLSQTNYLYLTDAGVLTVNTTGFPANTLHVPLATVVAGATTITSITDARKQLRVCGADPLIFTATAPTPTTGNGAGTGGSPTVSVSGSHRAGVISLTTGTTCSASADTVIMTFAAAFASAPKAVTLTPANAAARALASGALPYVDSANTTTALFKVTSGGTALANTTTYKWYYEVLG